LLWIVGTFLFVVPTLGYGWGYRGWGPPYPRYIQRRRAQQAAINWRAVKLLQQLRREHLPGCAETGVPARETTRV
jgi:hypothetical protein